MVVALDEGDVSAPHEAFGDARPDGTATEHEHLPDAPADRVERLEHLSLSALFGEHPNVIAGLDLEIAPRDDRLAVARDCAEEEPPVIDRCDVGQGLPGHRRQLADNGAEHDQIAARHRVHLVGTRDADESEDLLGGVGIGVDDQIGVDELAQLGTVGAAQFVGLEPYDGLDCAELLGERRGDQVDLVVLRDTGDQLGPIDASRPQDRGVRAAPDDRLDVELLAERAGDHLVLFDDDDVVVLGAEPLSEVPADLAGSDDHDMHSGPACTISGVATNGRWGRSSRRRPAQRSHR